MPLSLENKKLSNSAIVLLLIIMTTGALKLLPIKQDKLILIITMQRDSI